jgi:hypothetical protein
MKVQMDLQALTPRRRTRTVLDASANNEPLAAVQRVQRCQRHIFKQEQFVPRSPCHLYSDDLSRELVGRIAVRTRFGCLDGRHGNGGVARTGFGRLDSSHVIKEHFGGRIWLACDSQDTRPDHQPSNGYQKQCRFHRKRLLGCKGKMLP